MLTVDQMQHHPISEKLANLLCDKTDNRNPQFFRVLVGYYFSMAAATMRTSIATHDSGDIPVNMYALNLAPSGSGKTKSCNIMKNNVLGRFRDRFLNTTFPVMAEANIASIAMFRAARDGIDPDDSLLKVQAEFKGCGSYLFSFSKATSAAILQMRHSLLMAKAGSVNLQIDEIGTNLLGETEALNNFLELYDVGLIEDSLRVNSTVNLRKENIIDRTPTNMLLFGVPSALLDGDKTEKAFYSMLDTGYARRCFFGYSQRNKDRVILTAEEVYNRQTSTDNDALLEQLAELFENLADPVNMHRRLTISKATSILLIEYRQKCEREAEDYGVHKDSNAKEISHRYFKVLKLAGAYAFVDQSSEVTEEHIYQAIKLAEESGEALNLLLTRDKSHVKLAKYIASVKSDLTQADLYEDLPYYRGTPPAKADMMSLAISHGYSNNILIKKTIINGIEFFRGETLKESDINKMVVGYSNDITTGYCSEYAPFDKLHLLTQNQGLHWVSHHLTGGYRNEENAIPGFNLVVLDVEGSVNISTAKLLLKDYKFLIHTTKRHTDQDNRFRIIMPINFELALDAKDYKEFMNNLYEWLPFHVDTATNQRSRKWLAHNGAYEYNDGEVLNILQFIPKTSLNEKRKELHNSQQSMDNLERWVINNIGDGNRNNMLLRYALILVDAGFDFEGVRSRVISLNDKIPDKLDEAEIMTTIMMTTMKALSKR
jgi:hypothetical protein